MDRLLQPLPCFADTLLAALAELDRSLCHRQRWRRRFVAATVAASVLCWVAGRFSLPGRHLAALLFVAFALAALCLARSERRAQRHRERLAARLPAELRR